MIKKRKFLHFLNIRPGVSEFWLDIIEKDFKILNVVFNFLIIIKEKRLYNLKCSC